MSENTQIAQTILEQLGGRRLIVMTGARNFIAIERGLSFRVPRAKDGINVITVELTPADDYTVTFSRLRRAKGAYAPTRTVVSKHDGIYCDQLQDLFLRATGLETRLPRFITEAS